MATLTEHTRQFREAVDLAGFQSTRADSERQRAEEAEAERDGWRDVAREGERVAQLAGDVLDLADRRRPRELVAFAHHLRRCLPRWRGEGLDPSRADLWTWEAWSWLGGEDLEDVGVKGWTPHRVPVVVWEGSEASAWVPVREWPAREVRRRLSELRQRRGRGPLAVLAEKERELKRRGDAIAYGRIMAQSSLDRLFGSILASIKGSRGVIRGA